MRAVKAVALAAPLALTAVPAQAANQTVAVRDFSFTPDSVTIDIGDTVTWDNVSAAPHNVRFNDGSYEQPPTPQSGTWTAGRTFTAAGSFGYICRAHSFMTGRVIVRAPDGTVPDTARPTISSLRARPSALCTNRSRRCRSSGTRLTFRLSEAAKVEGTIRGRVVLRADGKAGANSVRYRARGLRPGRHRLSLVATDAAGNRSAAARVTVRVSR